MSSDRDSRRQRLLMGERTTIWRRHKARLFDVLVVLSVVALALSIVLPSLSRHRGVPFREKCKKQLRAIGQAMILYTEEHGGRYPAGADDLIVTQDISPQIFVCPSGTEEPAAAGSTPQETAANVVAPGHVSYVILSKGFSGRPPADAVLAYEPLTNHLHAGLHVLFGDGRVEWVPSPQAERLLAELNAGHNPPRAEAMK
jgi:type II secretory pathway pseudopilin PulG